MNDLATDAIARISDASNERDAFFSELQRRSVGLVSQELKNAHVLVVGCGSVGSNMAAQLARAGVGHFTLIDFDRVETHNLTRSAYRAKDIGRHKVECLGEILREVNPFISVVAHACSLENTPREDLRRAVNQCNFVYSAADDLTTQALLNRIVHFHKIPMARCGLYQGAHGGEAVIVVPGATPCLRCTLRGRNFTQNSDMREEGIDYEDGRRGGVVGLGCDVQFVVNVGARLVLGLLSILLDKTDYSQADKTDAEVYPHSFTRQLLVDQTNFVILGMAPKYGPFPEWLGDAHGQYAFQSAWIATQKHRDCDVCGENASVDCDPIDEIQAEFDI